MSSFVDSTFSGGTISLDGNEYVRCTFENTLLVYMGTAAVQFDGCVFRNAQWALDGPAANTLDLFRGMYHGMGEGGRALVEQMFDQIRRDPGPHGDRASVSTRARPASHRTPLGV